VKLALGNPINHKVGAGKRHTLASLDSKAMGARHGADFTTVAIEQAITTYPHQLTTLGYKGYGAVSERQAANLVTLSIRRLTSSPSLINAPADRRNAFFVLRKSPVLFP
jgi:hypothetical protein